MCFYYLVINIMIYLLYLFVDMNLICLVHFKYCTKKIMILPNIKSIDLTYD